MRYTEARPTAVETLREMRVTTETTLRTEIESP